MLHTSTQQVAIAQGNNITNEGKAEADTNLLIPFGRVQAPPDNVKDDKCTCTPVLEVKAVLGGSLFRASRGRGSFIFCRRITSVLSSKMLELTGKKKK